MGRHCIDFTYQANRRTSEMPFAEVLWLLPYTQLSITVHFADTQTVEAWYHSQSSSFLLPSTIKFLMLIPLLLPQQGKERHKPSQIFKPQSKNSGPHHSRHQNMRFTDKLTGVFSPKKLQVNSKDRLF